MTARTDATAALVILRRRVDDHFHGALHRTPGAMQCRSGCDSCCHARLSVFSIEAEGIGRALARLPTAIRARVRAQAVDPAWADRCPMLIDHGCSVYDERPLICRSHGVPLLIEDGDRTQHKECCPLNFATAVAPAASILRVEAVNQPLTIMARMYDPEAPRIALEDLAKAE